MNKTNKKDYIIILVILTGLGLFGYRYLPYKVTSFVTGEHDTICRGSRYETAYQRVQAKVLADQLTKDYRENGNCLIIHHPVSKSGLAEIQRMAAAFKEGLGDRVQDVYLAPIKDIDMEAELIPEEAMMEMTAEDFNKVIKEHAHCDVVITMVPLPFSEEELYAMDVFKMIEDPNKPGSWIKDPDIKYPRLGIYNGYVGNLVPLFREDLIHAMTLWRPNPTIDEEPMPSDTKEAFEKRYLLLTPQNLESAQSEYPHLFPKPQKK